MRLIFKGKPLTDFSNEYVLEHHICSAMKDLTFQVSTDQAEIVLSPLVLDNHKPLYDHCGVPNA